MKRISKVLTCLALVLSSLGARAADQAPAANGAAAGKPEAGGTASLLPAAVNPVLLPKPDVRDHTTPRRALRAYLTFARRADYRHAADLLDLSSLPAEERAARGPELARQLNIVLDQYVWFGDLEGISDAVDGAADDGRATGLDKIGELPLGSRRVDVLLARHDVHGTPDWKFADGTVLMIPELYEEHGHPWIEDHLPRFAIRWRFLEILLWQWIGLLLIAPVAWLLGRVIAFVLRAPLAWIVRRTDSDVDDRLLDAVGPPFRLFLATLVFRAGAVSLGLSVPGTVYLGIGTRGLLFVAIFWFLMRLVDEGGVSLEHNFRAKGSVSSGAVVQLARRATKILLVILAVLVLFQNLGYHVTGLLAGVGVAGLAISLAAQKTLENLFGGISVLLDQPVRVGDVCRFGSTQGMVEEIGLRSTRIRTIDRTLVSVPNGQFASEVLENYGSRDRVRIYQLLNLRQETTPEQLRAVLVGLRELLYAHPMIDQEMTNRARLVNFGASSLDVEFMGYVATANWDEFLAVREDVLLRVVDVLAAAGTGFAYPSQTIYLGRDAGIDRDRAHAAEQRVAALRREGRLPFPEHADGEREALRGTADYPPTGSSVRPGEAEDVGV